MADDIAIDAHAIIIGAAKSGTTSLFHYLKGHPEICPCIHKEPEFFSENQDYGAEDYGVYAKEYNELFEFDNKVHKYTLEASTGCTKYPVEQNVPKNIYTYGIRPKFIYVIRNPFDRIESDINYNLLDEKSISNLDKTNYINVSNYFLQLEQYRKYFSLDDILIIDFDDLKNQPNSVLKRVYDFLGITDSYYPEGYEQKYKTKAVSKYHKAIIKSSISPLLRYIPRPIKNVIRSSLETISPPAKRLLRKSEKEYIYNQLKDDMSNLHNAYGVDVKKWGFDVL